MVKGKVIFEDEEKIEIGITDSENLSSVKLMRSLGMKKNEMFENKLLCKGRLSVEHKYFRIKYDK